MFHSNDLKIEYYDTLPSTNDLARENLRHLRIIVADFQTNGRGQRENIWEAEKGSSILATMVYELKHGQNLDSEKLSFETARAISEVLAEEYPITPSIKFPNDILIDGKKVCGILIEVVQGFAIVGFGINITDSPDSYNATSVLTEIAKKSVAKTDRLTINKDLLLRKILDKILCFYENQEKAEEKSCVTK